MLNPTLDTSSAWTLAQFLHWYQALHGGRGAATWLGRPAAKYPWDAWTYQELIYRVKPQLIVELGSYKGGSACFLADMQRLCGIHDALTITVDTSLLRLNHSGVKVITGDDTFPPTVAQCVDYARQSASVMVIADSDHTESHVLAQLNLYAPLVTLGSYFIVEDTICDILHLAGCPTRGPLHAVAAFLQTPLGAAFTVDRTCEPYILTCAPGGFLRRDRV